MHATTQLIEQYCEFNAPVKEKVWKGSVCTACTRSIFVYVSISAPTRGAFCVANV